MIAWTETETSRHASLGDAHGGMVSCGSRWAWKVGNDGGLDDEATARQRIEELLLAAQRRAPASAPAVPPPPDALPAWAAVPGDDGRPVRRDWSAEQYHADNRLSRSNLVEFEESARLYHGRRTGSIPPRTQTAGMRFGTLVHMRLLEPEEFERRVWRTPDNWNGRTNAAKSELADVRARGMIECDAEEAARVEGCAAALLADSDARRLFENCEREVTFTWTERVQLDDDVVHIPCRARLDLLAPRRRKTRQPLIADLKTTDDPRPEEFVRAAVRYGYHYQPPFYARPVRDLFGYEPEFQFVIVRNRPPHEVVVRRVKPEDIVSFEQMVRRSLVRLAGCVLSDTWSSPWERQGVTDLEFPRWLMKEEES